MSWSRFWQRQRRDADLQRELDAYLQQETADRVADGMPADEAHWAAARKLGNVTRIREQVYERNSVLTLETLWRDVALRPSRAQAQSRIRRRGGAVRGARDRRECLGLHAARSGDAPSAAGGEARRARARHRRRVPIRGGLGRRRRALVSDVRGLARQQSGLHVDVLPLPAQRGRERRSIGRARPCRDRLRHVLPGTRRHTGRGPRARRARRRRCRTPRRSSCSATGIGAIASAPIPPSSAARCGSTTMR